MESLRIEILSKADLAAGKQVFGDNIPPDKEIKGTTLTNVAFIEGGQASGKTSIMLLLSDKEGNKYAAQVTQGLWLTTTDALRGVIERFGK